MKINCLVDTGSEVSTITESFFKEHFLPLGKQLLTDRRWLTLTAANGIEIPYIGYIELDVDVLGVTIPSRGILVVKDSDGSLLSSRKKEIPSLMGMNIIRELQQN